MLVSSSEQLQKVSWYLQLLQMGNHEKWIGLQFGQIVVAQVAVRRTMNNQQINKFIGLVTHTLFYSLSLSLSTTPAESYLSLSISYLHAKRKISILSMNRKRMLNAGETFFSWVINQNEKELAYWADPGERKGERGKKITFKWRWTAAIGNAKCE